MAGKVYTSVPYALVRLCLWAAVLAAGLVDGLKHKHLRSRGWQLYLLLLISNGLFVVKNLAFLAICIQGEVNDGWAAPAAYGFYIFFGDLAESFWLFVLLAISAGLCITRNSLGPHKTVCIVIPTIFLITSFVVDYVLFSQEGLDAFDYKTVSAGPVATDGYNPETGEYEYDPATDPLSNVDANVGFLFVICAIANMMAFLMSWFYMYDTARTEWIALQNAGAEGSQSIQFPLNQAELQAQAANQPAPSDRDSTAVGHSAIPVGAALLEEGQNASHIYGDIITDDLDAPKSVLERVADRDKVRLMKNFFFAVSIYLIMAMIVFIVPAFVPSIVDAALLVFYDTLMLIFLGGLLFVFRLRDSNQFLLLGEDGEGLTETTTELGVLYRDEEEAGGVQVSSGNGFFSRKKESEKAAAAVVPQPRYTLDDDDDAEIGAVREETRTASTAAAAAVQNLRTSGSGGSTGNVNAAAEAHGVVVQPLTSPPA